MVPGRHQPHIGGKIQKGLRVAASAGSFDDVYSSFLDEWSHERSPVLGGEGAPADFDLDAGPGAPDTVRTMYCDAVSYLPDDILAKVDRASMAVALETRVPFLDHRVAELAARIPLGLKVQGRRGKHIVRKLLSGLVPREITDRPKAGFGVPVGEWIKGPLRPWAEDLLDPGLIRAQGWFDPDIVRLRWQQHLSGQRDSTPALWAILVFQSWLAAQGKHAVEADLGQPAPRRARALSA
jgi:asparagine synthase (glutamine-hydrolysing)